MNDLAGDVPKVSVLMTTYNQERFIAQAIESVLAQRTDFDFDLIIGEDCSTDNTREIVKNYVERYPQKIKALLHPQNIGGCQNFIATYKACQGEYVAFLEGDDYWSSPEKLQKQVDFLDTHPECVSCFHWVEEFVQTTQTFSGKKYGQPPHNEKTLYTLDDILIYGCFPPACSVMSRNKIFGPFPAWYETVFIGDFAYHVLIAQHGKIGFLDETMAVYRLCADGAFGGLREMKKAEKNVYGYALVGRGLGLTRHDAFRRGFAGMCKGLYHAYKQAGKPWKAWVMFWKILIIAPGDFKRDMLFDNAISSPIIHCFYKVVDILRLIRIRGLLWLKQCWGESTYNRLRSIFRFFISK